MQQAALSSLPVPLLLIIKPFEFNLRFSVTAHHNRFALRKRIKQAASAPY